MIKKKRDYDLDKLRGLAMVYIMFIHTIYGTGLFNGDTIRIVKSYFLIEMPVFFFIAGASNYYSKYNSKIEFIIKRFKRILIPYYFYAFIMIVLNSILPKILKFDYKFSIVYWLMPITNKQESFKLCFIGALWFVSIYLLVMILFPYFKEYYVKKEQEKSIDVYLPLFYIILGILIIDVYNIYINIYLKKIIFYSFFMYLGLFWDKFKYIKDKRQSSKILFIFVIASLLGYVLLMKSHLFNIDMQMNKEKVNFAFMVYSIMGICFIGIIYRYIIKFIDFVCRNKVFNWIYKQYKDNTYTVFLFHMIALYFVDLIIRSGLISTSNEYIIFMVRIVILIPLSAILGYLFGFIECIDFNISYKKIK